MLTLFSELLPSGLLGAKRAVSPTMRPLGYGADRDVGQLYSSVTASAMWQCLCVALVLWLFPLVRSPQSIRRPNYATIRVFPVGRISYRPIVRSHISSQEVGGMTGETALLPIPSHP